MARPPDRIARRTVASLPLENRGDAPRLASTGRFLFSRQGESRGRSPNYRRRGYSLKGRITGRGKQEQLKSSVKGSFEFSARDGEFVRSPGVEATFDYLNATGDFNVAFPDLDKETFPYRLVSVKGRVDGEVIIGDEIIVHSTRVNLSGQGKYDLARKWIDGKALVAVLKPVDEVISRIPVVGSIFGGSLLGIPIRVAGPLDQPEVTYLHPADIGTEVLNMPLRILGLPMEALKLFIPAGGAKEKGIAQ